MQRIRKAARGPDIPGFLNLLHAPPEMWHCPTAKLSWTSGLPLKLAPRLVLNLWRNLLRSTSCCWHLESHGDQLRRCGLLKGVDVIGTLQLQCHRLLLSTLSLAL